MQRYQFYIIAISSAVFLLAAYLYEPLTKASMSPTPESHMIRRQAIVVGSGLAGLSAASRLLSHRIPVILLERNSKPGGNSIKASSGINGAPTIYQPVTEPADAFYTDALRSAGSAFSTFTTHRRKLVEILTKDSANAVEWLVKEKGVDLSKVAQLGGHSYPRTHRGSGQTPPGFAIMSTLLKALEADSLFEMRKSCTVTKVLQTEKRVTGVVYASENGKEEELYGPVIFASGGFGGDAEGLLSQYRPDLSGYPSTNDPRPGTQHLLTAVGAQLIDMDQVQVHPTGFVDPATPSSPLKFLAAEVLRGEGGILLLDGRRFINELDTREKVANSITSTTPSVESPKQWTVQLVLDEGVYNAAKSHADFYIFKGLLKKTTISELGSEGLETIRQYAESASGQTTDALGRVSFASWTLQNPSTESVIYVGTVTPVIHYTMGGVLINERSEVLDEGGAHIEGLWGAGEVTGGVHGGNRLGGSSLLECVVFGRIAGDQVAKVL